MTMNRRVLLHADTEELMSTVAGRVIRTATRTLAARDSMNIVLTGGSVGIGILAAIAANADRATVDWSRVHFW